MEQHGDFRGKKVAGAWHYKKPGIETFQRLD